MKVLLYYLAWEWVNIAIEFTATSFVKLNRWFAAVVFVNLATHPVFMILLDKLGRSKEVVLSCEAAIVLVEAAILTIIYGRRRWLRLFCIALFMNAASYLTGELMALQAF